MLFLPDMRLVERTYTARVRDLKLLRPNPTTNTLLTLIAWRTARPVERGHRCGTEAVGVAILL
jgi:hypothetical protein